jgi:hypothetical protein
VRVDSATPRVPRYRWSSNTPVAGGEGVKMATKYPPHHMDYIVRGQCVVEATSSF